MDEPRRSLAELLHDANLQLRTLRVENSLFTFAVGVLAVLAFGVLAGLLFGATIIVAVSGFAEWESRQWMRRKGLDR